MVLSLLTVNRVEEIVAHAQLDSRAPSIVAAVVRDGSVAHVSTAGETPVPDRDLQYRIGSISKTFTAAVVLGLRDEGRLGLADSVGEHLPGLPPRLASARLRDLLGMAGGLQREPDGEWWERTPGVALPELIAGLHDGKVAFAPHTRYHYSNLAYGLLGGVITELTGQSWFDAVAERILNPLGMLRTTYDPQEPYARGYVTHPWHATLHEEPIPDTGAMAPAGQLWSTVTDLSRWAAVLASSSPPATALPAGGLPAGALPTPATIAEMATPVVIADPDAWTAGYGLGLQLTRRGDRVFVGHAGSMPGYLAILTVHRPSRTGVVAFTNTYTMVGSSVGQLGMSILEAVLECEPAPPPAPWRPAADPPPAAVEPICGRWWWMGREYQMQWQAATKRLVFVPPRVGMQPWSFVEESPDVWRGVAGEEVGELLQVRRDDAGDVVALDIATFVYTRTP